VAQEPLTLRQAIEEALWQNPQAAIARADLSDAKATAAMARTQILPQLNFTEDMSRGNDPVYAFGTRLRQRQFTQADFALKALNFPQPIENFSTRFSRSWTAFDSFKTQREIRRADRFRESASSSAKAADQQIVFRVVEAYQSVLYAEREVAVAQHEQETAAAPLSSAEEHVKAGLAVESDRMLAEVNMAARREELIAVQGDVELAWDELREAMGASELKASALKPIESHPFPQQQLEEELATAAMTRPDLKLLGEAQIGIAVSTATNVAKSAAGVVLTEAGLGGIVAAVKEGRITFQRILTYTLNSMMKKILQVLLLAVGLLITGHAVLTPMLMILLMITGDFLTMSLTTDRVQPSTMPNSWKIGRITAAGVIFGACFLAFSTSILVVGQFELHLGIEALQTLSVVGIVFGSQVTTYVIRGRQHLWRLRPSLMLVLCSVADVLIIPMLAIYGIAMAPLPLAVVASEFAAAIAFGLVLDLVKIPVFTRLNIS
jgi:hypothetical protein